jgi:autotransporter-associated beta strand protein
MPTSQIAFMDGAVAGGSGSGGGGSGQAFGSGIFLQGNETITLAVPTGTGLTISDVIADQTGSGGTGTNAGAGRLVISGGGSVTLEGANTFTGGVTIESGLLELANKTAAGSGNIHFASTNGILDDSGLMHIPNKISGFRGSDEILFAGFGYAPGDHAVDNAGKVSIETSAGVTVVTFRVIGNYTSANFNVSEGQFGIEGAPRAAWWAAYAVFGGRRAGETPPLPA